MVSLDIFERLFVFWVFFFQTALIVHFAIRKPLFESYTQKIGWIVYALSFPAVVVSIILLAAGKSWSFWLGGFLCLIWAAFGYYVDYVKVIHWRKPIKKDVFFPYLTLYLGTIMFYWWPLALLHRPLWFIFGGLFVFGTVLNIRSH